MCPDEAWQIEHITNLLRTFLLSPLKSLSSIDYGYEELRYSAGVKFQVRLGKRLVDLEFKNNVLEIPPVELSDLWETLFQNIIAFELTSCAVQFFTTYIDMLVLLIKTSKDMDLLCDKRIVDNPSPSSFPLSISQYFVNYFLKNR